jgi:hypothetical protein
LSNNHDDILNDSDADVSNDDDVQLFLKNIEHSIAIDRI